MKKLICFAIVFLLGTSNAGAVFCALDDAPAASLLFPFVFFDFYDPYDPATTELIITNVSYETQVLQLTIWTDFGEPVVNFNILLTGYDVQRINLRQIFLEGRLPLTYRSPHTTFEGTQDFGPVSSPAPLNGEWLRDVLPEPLPTDALGTRCPTSAPGYPGQHTMPIPASILELFKTALTVSQRVGFFASDDCDGGFSDPYPIADQNGEPWMNSHDEFDLTWMYVTVDVVENCERSFPSEARYWEPFTEGGLARYDNVLIGDVEWIAGGGTTSGKAVHLEADQQLASVVPTASSGEPISFYHRYSSLQGAPSDAREPLPTAWAFPYVEEGVSDPRNTLLRVWKGSTDFIKPLDLFTEGGQNPAEIVFSNCLPYTWYAWDEEENVLGYYTVPHFNTDPRLIANRLPLVVQEVNISQFIVPDRHGWMLFVWPPSNFPPDGSPDAPDSYQVWMGTAHSVWDRRARFSPATPLANANCYPEQILPQLGVNYDYVDRYGYRAGNPGMIARPPATD